MQGWPGSSALEARGRLSSVRNTTEAINLVAVSLCRAASGQLALRAGDEVIITILEHHSDFVPWQVLCQEAGVAPPDCRVTPAR